jgi:hypothetical protein
VRCSLDGEPSFVDDVLRIHYAFIADVAMWAGSRRHKAEDLIPGLPAKATEYFSRGLHLTVKKKIGNRWQGYANN